MTDRKNTFVVLAAVALLSVGALLLVAYRSSERASGMPFDAALSAAGGTDAISKLFSQGARSKVRGDCDAHVTCVQGGFMRN